MKRFVLLLALLLVPACGDPEAGYEEDWDEPRAITEDDLDQWQEARSYMLAGHLLWAEGLSGDDLNGLIEGCYDAGAPRVMFAGIEEIGESSVSAWLVVELPTSKSARGNVIDAFNKVSEPYGQPAKDNGQKFIDLGMD
ncbi:MAG: hypothetical protein AAGD14_03710 [Planctomycetota bacterium]